MTAEADETLKKYISTPEGRKKLAESMVVPIRCGGGHYVDGKLHLFIGGWLIPAEIVHRAHRCVADLEIIREYQRTHERYVPPERKRA